MPRRGRLLASVARGLGLAALLVQAIGPILWLMLTSIKPRVDIFASTPRLWFHPTWEAWVKLFVHGAWRDNLTNSLLVAGGTTLVTTAVGSAAAYAFARYRFPWRRRLLFATFASRLLPPITAVVPLFLLLDRLGLIDTRLALVVIYTGLELPLAIWMLKTHFDHVPVELDEAAYLDGCTRWQTFRHVTFPLAAPGMAAAATFLFVTAWNEFTFAFIFTSTRARTLPVNIAQTIGEFEIYWNDLTAQATLIVLPVLVFALAAQRYLIQGLTVGSLK
ncbi:MAG: carbohydrate ABC transporter permease [Armatimonadota bacterium]|nr:carbohydrate ABC transporter permease [Armatimonadota bacterium]MDR7486733.1 carbohydrate ABC transporter permease [Armatimonadota bacterium]MDR7534287.1 carbohydrate ABC transporter permease [Armatimonadota bacterium]MDR7535362.1 carbohydrate ABC transporter permease [Armatimonadota bacterium]